MGKRSSLHFWLKGENSWPLHNQVRNAPRAELLSNHYFQTSWGIKFTLNFSDGDTWGNKTKQNPLYPKKLIISIWNRISIYVVNTGCNYWSLFCYLFLLSVHFITVTCIHMTFFFFFSKNQLILNVVVFWSFKEDFCVFCQHKSMKMSMSTLWLLTQGFVCLIVSSPWLRIACVLKHILHKPVTSLGQFCCSDSVGASQTVILVCHSITFFGCSINFIFAISLDSTIPTFWEGQVSSAVLSTVPCT